MADSLSRSQRAEVMGRIKGRNTLPERTVRAIIRRFGVRPRLHVASLPGSPDIVIDSAKTVVFVHGCFWHRHSCARGRSRPATRPAFWLAKFGNNVRRDRRARRLLRMSGWSVVVVWECQATPTNRLRLERRLLRLLLGRGAGDAATLPEHQTSVRRLALHCH